MHKWRTCTDDALIVEGLLHAQMPRMKARTAERQSLAPMREVASPALTRTMRMVRSDLERMLSERTSTDSSAPHTRTIDPDSIDTFVRRFPTYACCTGQHLPDPAVATEPLQTYQGS